MQKDVNHLFFVLSTADNYRVPLKNEHPDYINAVFINVNALNQQCSCSVFIILGLQRKESIHNCGESNV